ncbi:MAG TPA: transposase, partial [Thermoanaerobaculia bacterium]|nr:transposase [Thermoanaerobaculia bacterium]
VEELLRARVIGIACGYEDANDASRLAEDPVFKLIVGRDPAKGARLASQPTLSRFERSAGRKDLVRMGRALTQRVLRRQRRRRRKISRIKRSDDERFVDAWEARITTQRNGAVRLVSHCSIGTSQRIRLVYLLAIRAGSGHENANLGFLFCTWTRPSGARAG